MKYRQEIDGLRALAVVPVILFHAGFELFTGGFVGVDVFFVISGYLITNIIIEDIENKRFSIVNFYQRRARRILPALFFVLLVCIPFAWIFMAPYDLISFMESIRATIFFISNFYFWRNTGYFDPSADETPLLHTWSLAVEEQYYVLFPIFLILAWRCGKNKVFWLICLMAAISLLLSEWGWRNKASANFYLSPTRAWELFAGSIAAFIVQKNGVQKNNFLALVGLSAIVFSIFYYDDSTPFPSAYALLPVLGVVMVFLYADKETFAAKLLSTRVFVGIGLISYSAYLWHQPIIAFQYYIFNELYSYITIPIVFFIAYCSWLLIEKPMRESNNKRDFLAMLLAFTFLFFISLLAGHNKAIPDHINFQERRFNEVILEYGSECDFVFPMDIRCISNTKNISSADIVLLGDSHAEHLYPGLSSSLSDFSLISLTTSGAPFFTNLEVNNIFKYIENMTSKPRLIIFSMHYLGMLREIPVGSSFEVEIGRVVDKLKSYDIKIILLSDVPKFYNHPRQCISSIKKRGSERLCQKSQAAYKLESYQYINDLMVLSKDTNLQFIFLDDVFCNQNTCSMIKGDELLYRDDNHLSIAGSFAVSGPIALAARGILN